MSRLLEIIPASKGHNPRGASFCLALALLLALAVTAPAVAQSSADAGQIGTEVAERYRVMVLRSGLVLTPIEPEEGLSAIEIGDEGVALDGLLVEESELRARLGDVDADLVLSLQGLDDEVRRALFGPDADPVASELELEAEVLAEEEGDPVLDEDEARMERNEARAERDEARAEREERWVERRRVKSHSDSKVVVGERVVVESDESYGEIVVFGNDLVVHGEVRGDAVAIGGSVRVLGGEVTGSVSAIGGSVELKDGAQVHGEAVSVGGTVDLDDDVEVAGDIVEVPFAPSFHFGKWSSPGWRGGDWDGDSDLFEFSPFRFVTRAAWKVFGLVLLVLMACFVMMVARGPLERVERRVVAEPWKSGLVGLVAQVLFVPFLVLLVVVLAISIIGIPLLLLVPFAVLALIVVAFLGYSAVAYRVGKFFKERVGWKLDSPYAVLIVGVVLIEALCLVGDLLDFGWLWFFAAMFTLFGALVEYVAWTVGFGGALLTRFGTSEGWGGAASGELPPVPPPASDDAGEMDLPELPPVAAASADDWASDSIFEGEPATGEEGDDEGPLEPRD